MKPGEITNAFGKFQNGRTYLEIKDRWEDDFSLYRLQPYDAGKGYYSYTSNAPRVLADKVISMLVKAYLNIHVPEDILTDEEARVANNVERFIYGSLYLNDQKFLKMPDMPPLRHQMAWHACIRGGFGLRVYVHKNAQGETFPDIMVWDLYNTAYSVGDDGLDWACFRYKITKEQANKFYGVKGSRDLLEVYDYWDKEKHAVVLQNEFIEEPVDHGKGHCPVYILRTGSLPPVFQEDYEDTLSEIGQSVFAANRNIYPILNKTLSDLHTLVRRGVKTPLGYWSETGSETLDQDIYQVEKSAVIPLKVGEEIKPLLTESMPTDAAIALNWDSGEIQRGGLSHVAHGEVSTRLSGFAISQLQAAVETIVVPFAQILERGYNVISTELTNQYSGSGYAPIKVRGRDSRGMPFGFNKAFLIKPSDVKGDWKPEVTLEPIFPKDDAQAVQMAQMLRQGPTPLLSDETLRSEYLKVRDPDLEAMKVSREWASQLIINKLWDAYKAAVTEAGAGSVEAMNILAELQRIMMATGQGPQGQQAGQLSPSQAASMGTPGAGITPGATGMPASATPPEAQGGFPPGALNATPPPEISEEV